MPLGSPGSTIADVYPNNGRFKVKDVQKASSMIYLNDVDIVFTDDKDKWTRCVVFEIKKNTYVTGSG